MNDRTALLDDRAERGADRSSADSPAERMMPTQQEMSAMDYGKYSRASEKSVEDVCGKGFGIDDGFPSDQQAERGRQAEAALNAPVDREAKGTPAEKKMADTALQTLEKSSKETDPAKQAQHLKALKDQFATMNPQAAAGVIAEMNRALEARGMRIAQSPNGEIWLGERNRTGRYSPSAKLREPHGC